MSGPCCDASVMIVDDDRDVRETLADLLEEHGYHVTLACNGVEALTLLKTVRVCVILLDLSMPEMNGWDFLRQREVDSLDEAKNVPVYISTSDPAKAPTGFPVFPKPVDVQGVLAAVKRHCEET